jgi:CDGSH-type Zn-finger protein
MTEAKGQIAARSPAEVELEEGVTVWWCRCGRSQNQPFCDGSHEGTQFSPVEFTPERSDTFWLCRCKQTSTQPFCDGTHNTLI